MASSQSSGPLNSLFPNPTSIRRGHSEKLSCEAPITNKGKPSSSSTVLEGEPNSLYSDTIMALASKSTEPFMNASKSREIVINASVRPSSIDGVLDIALHHASDIHNICIYGNQDVYAKFSITHTKDAIYSTQPIRAGGKNPVFNQSMQILVSKLDAVLKCEIWMMSCARTYLEDQLLGFVLVPLCDLLGQGTVTKDYSLSSTDLFHMPAGTVCLSLTFYLRGTDIPFCVVPSETSLSNGMLAHNGLDSLVDDGTHDMMANGTQGIMLNGTHDINGKQCMTHMEYNNIEFPDLQSTCENQHLVTVYLNMANGNVDMDEETCGQEGRHDDIRSCASERELSGASFLQLGSSPMADCDCEMGLCNGEKSNVSNDGPGSPSGYSVSSGDVNLPSSSNISASGTTMVSNTEEVRLLGLKFPLSVDVPHFTQESNISQASSRLTSAMLDDKLITSLKGQESMSSFTAPLATISLESDEPVAQQQIVDMYMKSMQQFTESLAKMKLPLDVDKAHNLVELEKEPRVELKGPTSEPATKDGHRVFYGSRAFF